MTANIPLSVNLADLLTILGEKEVTIYALRSEVAALKAALAAKDEKPNNG